MDFNPIHIFVITLLVLLVLSLYREWFNPALSFFLVVLTLLVMGILTPVEVLQGLSNPQLIVIFLLMMVTAGMRELLGDRFFLNLFSLSLSPRAFLLRLMVSVSTVSAFLNNTPIVAFLIPYVKEWAEKKGVPVSKFLIPLSYATILGGMITVVGTSTNLILAGLMTSRELPMPAFTDFLYLGLLVTVAGWIYLYFWGYYLLPAHRSRLEAVRQNRTEYIVETMLYPDSPLSGKTVRDAGLRNLRDLFLVEIIRKGEVISPVTPDEVLQPNDLLFFSGNTQAISNLIQLHEGLRLSEQPVNGAFHFLEAVVPAHSDLIGKRIRDSDFRKRFNASIVAIHRNGKKVAGKIGEMTLAGGDFLLLLTGENQAVTTDDNHLYFISRPQKLNGRKPMLKSLIAVAVILLLAAGISGLLPLFSAALGALCIFLFSGVLNYEQLRKNLDFSLLIVLVSSLAIATALDKTGTADRLAGLILAASSASDVTLALAVLFVATIMLTAIITNPAAVSMMFPVALSLAEKLELDPMPFCMAIAFAASGDFMTPIGYQTNLMVYGPGGYSFRDFVRVGTPFTLIYCTVCITFILWYYQL
ncbi:MAG: SLC13 family permease [Cyclobacteriaceae bacterium]|nr:SLC13 family permease [Cyclobacteriaceae bacterium]